MAARKKHLSVSVPRGLDGGRRKSCVSHFCRSGAFVGTSKLGRLEHSVVRSDERHQLSHSPNIESPPHLQRQLPLNVMAADNGFILLYTAHCIRKLNAKPYQRGRRSLILTLFNNLCANKPRINSLIDGLPPSHRIRFYQEFPSIHALSIYSTVAPSIHVRPAAAYPPCQIRFIMP